ncbi:MAG: ATP-binding protein, partial [bacterium]|nr:ATP-binding protein [bacterium]
LKDKTKVLYFTFDEEQPSVEDLLQNYEEQMGVNWKKEKIFVFLDEIQKLENFQNQLKVLYDLYPNIKFFISGSTSLFLRQKSLESLAGRILEIKLNPLNFPEYLRLKEKEGLLLKPKLFYAEIKREFSTFLTSQFPESVFMANKEERKEYFLSIIKKIVYEDLRSVYKFDNPDSLYSLCKLIGQHPGGSWNLFQLANDISLSSKTVSLYFSYLESGFLIRKFYNFSRNIASCEKRIKRYYLSSPSFSWALTDFIENSALFENYLASVLETKYFYRDSFLKEVDFVLLGKNDKIIPLEAKYSEDIKKDDVNNLISFMKKFKVEEGVVACLRESEQKMIFDDNKIINLTPYFKI